MFGYCTDSGQLDTEELRSIRRADYEGRYSAGDRYPRPGQVRCTHEGAIVGPSQSEVLGGATAAQGRRDNDRRKVDGLQLHSVEVPLRARIGIGNYSQIQGAIGDRDASEQGRIITLSKHHILGVYEILA